MKFIGRKISSIEETVGDKLQNAREQKGLSLEEISKEINIKEEYLKALEDGNYPKLPDGLYKETFLKKYSDFLGLNTKKILNDFRAETGTTPQETKKITFSRKKLKRRELMIFPKIVKNILIGIIVSIFFVYLGIYLKNSFSTPEIKIIEPAENLITNNDSINIIGQTNEKTQITINGRSVLNDEKGIFEQTVNLKKGVNIITIIAQKKYGPKKIVTRQILVE